MSLPATTAAHHIERTAHHLDAATGAMSECMEHAGHVVAAAETRAKAAEELADTYAERLAAAEQLARDMHTAAWGEEREPLLGMVTDMEHIRAAFIAQRNRADVLDTLCREQRERADKAERAVEDHRGALSHAVGLGTSAPWDAIHARAIELHTADQRAVNDDAESRSIRLGMRVEQRAERAEHRADQAEQRIRNLEQQTAELRRCNSNQAQTIRDATERANAAEADRDHEADTREQAQKDAKAANERARAAQVAAHNLSQRTPDRAQRTLDAIRNARDAGTAWVELGMYYRMTPEEAGRRARAWRTTAEHIAERHAQRAEADVKEIVRKLDHAEKWAETASRVGTRHMVAAERYHAAWKNARLRAKQTQERAELISARVGRYRESRNRWTRKALDRGDAIARVRNLTDTQLGPLAAAAVRNALAAPTEPQS